MKVTRYTRFTPTIQQEDTETVAALPSDDPPPSFTPTIQQEDTETVLSNGRPLVGKGFHPHDPARGY